MLIKASDKCISYVKTVNVCQYVTIIGLIVMLMHLSFPVSALFSQISQDIVLDDKNP
jgi:hypothetical protein